VSIAALNWAFRINLKPSWTKFLLVALADCANDDGECWPSIAALCAKTSEDRKTVISGLDQLEQMGILRDSGKRTGRTKQVKVYLLNSTADGTGTVDGTVPSATPKSTVRPSKQYRPRHETVPPAVHGILMESSRNPLGNLKSPQRGFSEEEIQASKRRVRERIGHLTGKLTS
jgi:hypothetical protein